MGKYPRIVAYALLAVGSAVVVGLVGFGRVPDIEIINVANIGAPRSVYFVKEWGFWRCRSFQPFLVPLSRCWNVERISDLVPSHARFCIGESANWLVVRTPTFSWKVFDGGPSRYAVWLTDADGQNCTVDLAQFGFTLHGPIDFPLLSDVNLLIRKCLTGDSVSHYECGNIREAMNLQSAQMQPNLGQAAIIGSVEMKADGCARAWLDFGSGTGLYQVMACRDPGTQGGVRFTDSWRAEGAWPYWWPRER
jgi:hypothetical protein